MYLKTSDYWMLSGIKSLRDISIFRIKKLIETTSNEVDEYCNTRFEPTKDNYTLDLKGKFYTRQRPLLEVTELKLLGYLLEPDEDYYVYPENSKVELVTTEADKYKKALEIEYFFGYKTIPATVKLVVADLIKLDVETANSSGLGMQSENWDSEYSYTRHSSKDFTPAELRKNILARLDGFIEPEAVEINSKYAVRARLL